MTAPPRVGDRGIETAISSDSATVSASRRGPNVGNVVSWIVFILAMLYFFLPLIATLEFSLRARPAGGAYVNFMMDEGEDRVKATYRGNYERLARIKAKYDPHNLFSVNQNIKPVQKAL